MAVVFKYQTLSFNTDFYLFLMFSIYFASINANIPFIFLNPNKLSNIPKYKKNNI